MQIQISWLLQANWSQLIWIYTVCKDRTYLGSAGQGLILHNEMFTFPEVLIPLARQMMTITQARSRQRANSHFMEPISSTLLVISNTTLLQEKNIFIMYLDQHITKTSLFKYLENFSTKKKKKKNENFQLKKIWYFSCFCSKHRLWVLVRTASMRWFQWVPTIYVLSMEAVLMSTHNHCFEQK